MGGKAKKKHVEYYEMLGCEPEASAEELKKAYRRKALRLHPDRGGDPEEFKRMKAAYDVLSDPSKRKMYDRYGADAIRVMEGEIPSSAAFITELRKRDRVILVVLISMLSLLILLFPILSSLLWDSETTGKVSYSWAVPFISLWVLQAVVFVGFTMEVRQPPLDFSNPDVDEEAKQMWKTQEKGLNVIRAVFYTTWTLVLLFEVLLVLRLDGTINWAWPLVMLPWTVLQALVVALRLYSAPAVFVASDPDFNPPEPESGESAPSPCTSKVLGDPAFWLFALQYVKWSLMLFVTSIVLGIVADWNESGRSVSFYFAAIPLLLLIGFALVLQCVLHAKNGSPPPPPGVDPEHAPKMTFVGVFVQWLCSYGMVLIMITTGASKLSDPSAFSAFAVFSPVFFVVGCVCCMCSCMALTVTAEDLQGAEETARQQAAGEGGDATEALNQQGDSAHPPAGGSDQPTYGTMSEDSGAAGEREKEFAVIIS